jgi:putative ABC transport system substrate-binding protein
MASTRSTPCGMRATYVDKISGCEAGRSPIEQPTKIDLIINGKTARALGLVIPTVVRMQAVRVIE